MKQLTAKKKLGNLGEKIATDYLRNKNYTIVATNYTNKTGRRLGEIDIIAEDIKKNELVFVEVKARKMQKFINTNPEENVNYFKMQKLDRIAYFFLQENELTNVNYRFDILAIWIDQVKRRARIKHIKSI